VTTSPIYLGSEGFGRLLLAVITQTIEEVIAKMLELLTHHHLRDNRHVKTLFMRHSGSCQVNVNLVAFFLWFAAMFQSDMKSPR
jgi:hypothetical protein